MHSSGATVPGFAAFLRRFGGFFLADLLDFAGAEFAFVEFFFGFLARTFLEFGFAFGFFAVFFGSEFFFEDERRRARNDLGCVGSTGPKQAGEAEEDHEDGKPEQRQSGGHGRIHRLAMAPPLAKSAYSRALHPQQGLLHR